MNTKYGMLFDPSYNDYISHLIDNVFKLIPLREEGCKTIPNYINSINRELFGLISFTQGNEVTIIRAINLLESAAEENNWDNYRADVLHCCNLIDSLKIGVDKDV